MPFRDRQLLCPRCRVVLERHDDDREAWHCPRCTGAAVGVGDLIDDLLEVAPHLRPEDRVRDLVTRSRRARAELVCPACEQAMQPAYLAAVEVERCRTDNLLWLDRGEREAIVARAGTQPRTRPLGYLRAILGGPETGSRVRARTWGRRLVTVLSLLSVLAALPLAGVGMLMVAVGTASTGLDAMAAPVGWFVLALAALMFLLGGVVFVRAAR